MPLRTVLGFTVAWFLVPGALAQESPLAQPLWTLFQQGQYAAVVEQGQQLLTQHPDDRELHHVVGRAILEAGYNLQTDQAIEHLQKSMTGLPDDHWMVGWSHFYIGYAYELSNRAELAISSYQQAIKLKVTPQCTTAAQNRLRQLNGDPLQKTIEELSRLYGEKKFANVVELARKTLADLKKESDPPKSIGDPLFDHFYGRALVDLQKKNQLRDAITVLQQSLDKRDGRTWIESWNYYYLGWAHEQLGEMPKATEFYNQAITLDATPECTRSAQYRLRHLGKDPYENWLTQESDHFILRYPPDSPIAKKPSEYLDKLESAYKAITQKLRVESTRKITFYLYNNVEQGKEITGAELGWADRDHQTVHQHVGQTLGHEMTHCLSHYITKESYCDSVLINEGLAVYQDQTRRDKHQAARLLLSSGKLPTFVELEQSFRAREDAYPLAGSFVAFLFEVYSPDCFFGFWRDSANGQYERAFKKHFQKDSAQLSEEWAGHLRSATRN
ncbi:MAG: hypothetical protein HJJLKODD_01951 [Phycisphaerae bacterium]|nr:hypothetical protein [Phycisphaerae bacterium]